MKGEFTLTAQGIEVARQVGVDRARALAKRHADVHQLIVFRSVISSARPSQRSGAEHDAL